MVETYRHRVAGSCLLLFVTKKRVSIRVVWQVTEESAGAG